MKLLVTGATGFIGSHVVLGARAWGHEVVAAGLARTPAECRRLKVLREEGVEVRQGPLLDEVYTADLVRGCDAVIHLAAAQHEANVPDSYFRDVNVEATRQLLAGSAAANVTRFVYGSTIGVYGSAPPGAITEDAATRPVNIYGKTKLEAEKVVLEYTGRLGVTIIRISETYGPEDERLLKLFRAIDAGAFVMIGKGDNEHHPIHVHDLVRGILSALTNPAALGQTFLLAGPKSLTTKTMAIEIAAALGRKLPVWTLPMWPAVVLAVIAEAVVKPFGLQPPLHRRRLDFFRKSFRVSTVKASRVLGFSATISFAAGARDVAAWYRGKGMLTSQAGRAPSVLDDTAGLIGARKAVDVPLAQLPEGGSWRYSEILEFTHDAIIIWEMDGVGIIYWNRAAELLYGFNRHEAMGRTTHVLRSTQIEGGTDGLEKQLSRYGVWAGHLRHRRSDGREVVVQSRLALLSQSNDKWLVLEVNRDLTANDRVSESRKAMELHLETLRGS